MKKVFLALMCTASMALIAACGGNANNNEGNTDETATEQGEKSFDQMNGIEKCADALQRVYNLTLADIQPDFEFTEQTEGFDKFDGDQGSRAVAVYQKKDGTAITADEFKAWAGKIYEITKKMSQDGKNVEGPAYAKSNKEAMAEKSLEKGIDGGEWNYRMNDQYYAIYIHNNDGAKKPYVDVTFSLGIQKTFEDALDDATKQLKK
ncbi:MAG: hypothetical protein J6T33_09975 [Bacteroidales bacterium]|nr:hypothetical protein [Bacteroidales bacterium]MBP5241673.1 hypothetical protein [Bacteroidales bacterium]MBP5758561.1 hypothetical protein [Bacteroidales bacterium]